MRVQRRQQGRKRYLTQVDSRPACVPGAGVSHACSTVALRLLLSQLLGPVSFARYLLEEAAMMRNFGRLTALVVMTLSPAVLGADPAPGAWRGHEYTFSQHGFTTSYSCTGLAAKVRSLLRAAGAREDMKVVPLACGVPGNPSRSARVRVAFHTLAPAAAQTQGVPGVWRSVSIQRSHTRDLEAGDCELVDRFRKDLLPFFSTRNVLDRVRCLPHQNGRGAISLSFDVFVAARAD